MPNQTPRLGLNTFEQGEDWDHTDTVEAVDEHAIEHGPIADRPTEGDYDDELYHATDQGITWRWDASSADWDYFSGQGSSDQPVPETSHYEALSADVANIGEGTGTDGLTLSLTDTGVEYVFGSDGVFSAPDYDGVSTFPDKVGASITIVDSQTITANTETTVGLSSTAFDDYGGLDATNDVYTIQEGGIYYISASIQIRDGFLANGDYVDLRILENGSTSARNTEHSVGGPVSAETGILLQGAAGNEYSFTLEPTADVDTSGAGGDSRISIFRVR